MTSLTRADIAEEIQKKLGFSFSESTSIVDSLVEELCLSLETNDALKVTSFGTFSVRQKKARMGRNPKTKVAAVISGRKVVSFSSSNVFDEFLNNNI